MMKVHKRKKQGQKESYFLQIKCILGGSNKKTKTIFNWEHGEVLVFMKAKCDQRVTSMDRFGHKTCSRLLW